MDKRKKDSLLRGLFSAAVGYLTKQGVDKVAAKAVLSSPQAKKVAKEVSILEAELEARIAETELARKNLEALMKKGQ